MCVRACVFTDDVLLLFVLFGLLPCLVKWFVRLVRVSWPVSVVDVLCVVAGFSKLAFLIGLIDNM